MHPATPQNESLVYTAKVHTIGGREKGSARSSDGRLDVTLSVPSGPGTGTNPEQLLAAGWSACLGGAISLVARQMKIALPTDATIDTEVDLLSGRDGYFFRARANVGLPGIDRTAAQTLVETAHRVCPFSKALRGESEVSVNLV